MSDHHSVKDRITEQYRGSQGVDYHAQKHSRYPFVKEVVARQRAAKLQPFVGKEDRVLEFGVGVGLNLFFLECASRTGYDLSDAGRETCESAGIRYITDLNVLGSEQFDAIICHHVLEHVPDPVQILGKIGSLLRPGGRLLLCVPYETNRMYRRYRAGDPDRHLFSWNALTLGNLVSLAGFEIELCRIHPFGYEQRLAPLARLSPLIYRAGLRIIRGLRPADEVFLVGTKRDQGKPGH